MLLLVYYNHLCRFTPKVLVNQFDLLEMMTCPITNPITNPITTTFQLNPSLCDDSWLSSKVGVSIFSHFLNNEKPHNPKFPSNEEFWNVPNCLSWGIGPVSWFWDKFKYARNVRLVSCWGICPWKLFWERSNDWSSIWFPKDDGIGPVKLLLDKLNTINSLRFSMLFGISP